MLTMPQRRCRRVAPPSSMGHKAGAVRGGMQTIGRERDSGPHRGVEQQLSVEGGLRWELRHF
jgi:hypothetical protein